jgi:uncharacterized protein YidB (DUF937 family)
MSAPTLDPQSEDLRAPIVGKTTQKEIDMGLLDDLLAGAMGGAAGQRSQGRAPSPAGGGDMSRILMALMPVVLAMLAGRGGGGRANAAPQGGGLEDILGQMLGGGAQRGGMPGGGLGDLLGQVLGGGAAMGGGGMRGGGAPEGLGGISDLLRQLDQSGFGREAQSWVGAGDNLPISPGAVEQIFGRGGLENIARYAGLSEQETSQGLSQLLPEVVNHVTPSGEVPDLDQLTASIESLARSMRA